MLLRVAPDSNIPHHILAEVSTLLHSDGGSQLVIPARNPGVFDGNNGRFLQSVHTVHQSVVRARGPVGNHTSKSLAENVSSSADSY